MSAVYKIQSGTSRATPPPPGYVLQYGVYNQSSVKRLAYMFSDSQVYEAPMLVPSNIYVGPARKYKTIADAVTWMHSIGAGLRHLNLYLDAGTYQWQYTSDFKHPFVTVRKADESDSVTLQVSGTYTYSSTLRFQGIKFSGQIIFRGQKSLQFLNCTFTDFCRFDCIQRIDFNGCTLFNGIQLHQDAMAVIYNSTISTASRDITVLCWSCNRVWFDTVTVSNIAGVSAATGIRLYDTFMETPRGVSVTVSRPSSGSSYGISATNMSQAVVHAATLTGPATGFSAMNNSIVRVMDGCTFNNVTTQYSPSLNTAGNTQSIIITT